jgi:hypothetical protein
MLAILALGNSNEYEQRIAKINGCGRYAELV